MIKKYIKRLLITPFFFNFLSKLKKKIYLFLGNKPHYSKQISLDIDNLKVKNVNLWNSPNWINHVEKTLKSNFNKKPSIHESVLINTIKTINYLTKQREINVIDFGGGCGVLTPHLRNLSKDLNLKINSLIIDSELNIKLGKKILMNDNTNDIKFYDQTKFSLYNILQNFKEKNDNLILNISSVMQYIHPYKEFMHLSLKHVKPIYVCITRFPRCENAPEDAYGVQNISTPFGFCGSAIVNLFEKNSLIDEMKKLNYELITEKYNYIGDTNYFIDCDNKSFKKMTLIAYVFIKKS